MLRVALFILSLLLTLKAETLNKEYALLAGTVEKSEGKVHANKDVVIFSQEYTFRADSATYDLESSDLVLVGDVDIMLHGQIMTRVDETTFNLKTKIFKGDNLFAYDTNTHIWFNASATDNNASIYNLKKTTLSSCERLKPDWKITFSKGTYNREKEYVSIYNPTFYIADVPLLYLPWFGFPTKKNRESGFLKPILGFENSENLFFVLPYYIAHEENWDLELDPQMRLNRGIGLYSTLRFVDTDHSHGEINLGVFEESKDYYEKNNLENKTHYGLDIKYENSRLLSDFFKKDSFHDGVLIDIAYLNDIDYHNLDHKKDWASSKLVTSKANYVFYRDDDYFGLYGKYFIDTEKKSNADTLQTLPSFQYHKFVDPLKIPNLYYALDYKFKNNFREQGLNAKQHELSIPLTLHKSFFGDYLKFQASENFYYSRVNYTEGNETTDNADYFSNYHKLSLSSDLSKGYETFTHNVQADLSMIIPSFEDKKGYFADFLPFNLETKSLAFRLNQYYYRHDGFNFFTHRLRQVLYDDENYYKYGDFENQIIYHPSHDIMINNTLFFSHEYSRIKKLQTYLTYKKDRYDLRLNHSYEYEVDEKDTNFVSMHLNAKIDRKYDIFGSLEYDIEDQFTKEWTLGWRMKKRCWDYMFRYKESVTPSLTSAGTESLVKRGVLLFVRFSPFGGMSYQFNQDSSLGLENIEGL